MKKLNLLILSFLILGCLSAKGEISDLSKAEKHAIQLMREEEKLAHDVYLFLYEKWELPIFQNISNSETRHFEAIATLIETFKISDPTKTESGKFQNQNIQHLYDSLTISGSESLIAALKAGAFIEELDISDLQKSIKSTTNETILFVYENLLRASGNHLRAFTGQLESRNINYSPVVLQENNYQIILETPHQKGGGGNGNCGMQQNNSSGNLGNGKMRRHRGRN